MTNEQGERPTRTWYVYQTLIDFFFGWQKRDDLIRRVAAHGVALGDALQQDGGQFLTAHREAYSAVRRARVDYVVPPADGSAYGWEGDGQWLCSAIPGDPDNTESAWVFLVKQNNNGTTWVASPFPLPWLGEPCRLEPEPFAPESEIDALLGRIFALGLRPVEGLILVGLALTYDSKTQRCDVELEPLIGHVNVSRSYVLRLLSALVKKGHLSRHADPAPGWRSYSFPPADDRPF